MYSVFQETAASSLSRNNVDDNAEKPKPGEARLGRDPGIQYPNRKPCNVIFRERLADK